MDRVARLRADAQCPQPDKARGTPAPEGRGGCRPASSGSRAESGRYSAAAGLRLAPHTSAPSGGSWFCRPCCADSWDLPIRRLSCDVTTLESCKLFLRPEAGPSRLWPTSSLSKRWCLLATPTGATRNSLRARLAHLTDSDLCMTEWYFSSFRPNLTELAGSLTQALRVKAASKLSLQGLIRKEVVRGLERCRALLKVGEAHVSEGTSA